MDKDSSLQSIKSEVTTPVELSSEISATNTPHIPLPTPTPKKSFLKKPLFWIAIIILFIFTGSYYFIYQNLENKVSQLSESKNVVIPSVTPSSIIAQLPSAVTSFPIYPGSKFIK